MKNRTPRATICLLTTLTALMPSALHADQAGISIFPPQNEAAGGGLLYFPQGGNTSLYAVPVLSDPALVSATNSIAAQIAAQTEALNAIAEKLGALPAVIPPTVTTGGNGGSGGNGGNGGTGGSTSNYVSYPKTITCSAEFGHTDYGAKQFSNTKDNSTGISTLYQETLIHQLPVTFQKLADGTYVYTASANVTLVTKTERTATTVISQNAIIGTTFTLTGVYDARTGGLLNASGNMPTSTATYTHKLVSATCPAHL